MIRKYAEIFCWKNVSSFCSAKATIIFSAKNIRILYIESAKTVNKMTLKQTMLWTTGLITLYPTCPKPWTSPVTPTQGDSLASFHIFVHTSVYKQSYCISSETTGQVFFQACLGYSPCDLVVHAQIWFWSIYKYGRHQLSWIFLVIASPL